MIGTIAIGIAIAATQIAAPDDTEFLDRFVGKWEGRIDFPQWLQDEFESIGILDIDEGFSSTRKFELPDIFLEIEITSFKDVLVLDFTKVVLEQTAEYEVISRNYQTNVKGDLLMPRRTWLASNIFGTLIKEIRNVKSAYELKRRGNFVTWKIGKIDQEKLGSQRAVLQPVWDKYLVLHIYSTSPELALVLSIYLWPSREELTPTQ